MNSAETGSLIERQVATICEQRDTEKRGDYQEPPLSLSTLIPDCDEELVPLEDLIGPSQQQARIGISRPSEIELAELRCELEDELAQLPDELRELSLQSLLAGRKVRDSSDNRSNLYVVALANSGAGKNFPRKTNEKILLYPPVLKKHKLYFSQAVIWDKQHPVLTRKDFMGAHEWCQPPETRVLTSAGSSRISDSGETVDAAVLHLEETNET